MQTNHPTPRLRSTRHHVTALLRPAVFLGTALLGFAGVDAPTAQPTADATPTAAQIDSDGTPPLMHIAAVSGPIPTETAKVAALNGNFPAGLTLKRAGIKQTCLALHLTVLQHHDDAVDLLRIAVLARTPRQGDGRLACDDLRRLVEAAATAAPDKTSQLIDMADSLDPDCADSLQAIVAGAAGDYGTFGVGFGPGTPGSPGFTGSAPSGAFALPTPNPPVTSTAND